MEQLSAYKDRFIDWIFLYGPKNYRGDHRICFGFVRHQLAYRVR